jgi:catechol 2,3-dioxygenase-like lactoylglutathione lyase family enzyme
MSRFHVHVHVEDVAKSARFYSTLFGAEPSVLKDDYAKWMLEEPKVNFAISTRGERGISHLGIQVETDAELREIAGRLRAAGEKTADQEAVTCCYARGNKNWASDPAGLRWETFFTFADATIYGEDTGVFTEPPKAEGGTATACCG